MSSPWLVHDERLVPTVVVLSHEEQLDRLRAAVPAAAQAAVVVGDPCYDLLVASRPLRESYRQALGVGADQQLVVVTTTWGRDSLYGQHPALPAELAARLPLDRYRVVLALHPNIVAGHSRWQLDLWLTDCRRAGALVLPDEGLWRQALVAADLTIGDHGSVTFYSAALGVPVLLAAAPTDAVDPRSPVGLLLRAASRLVVDEDLLTQVDHAIAHHDSARLAPIVTLTTSHAGKAGERLREVVYDLLGAPLPQDAVDTAVLPVPDVPAVEARAQLVEALIEPDGDEGELVVDVTRYGVGALGRWQTPILEARLVVDVRASNTRLLELCDIAVHAAPLDARHWITETLRALPGCAVATARAGPGTWLAGTADDTLVRFDIVGEAGCDPATFASALHAWLVAGFDVSDLPPVVRVRVGERAVVAHATGVWTG